MTFFTCSFLALKAFLIHFLPGYSQVGMRYFHLNKNKYHCPVINLDKVRRRGVVAAAAAAAAAHAAEAAAAPRCS